MPNYEEPRNVKADTVEIARFEMLSTQGLRVVRRSMQAEPIGQTVLRFEGLAVHCAMPVVQHIAAAATALDTHNERSYGLQSHYFLASHNDGSEPVMVFEGQNQLTQSEEIKALAAVYVAANSTLRQAGSPYTIMPGIQLPDEDYLRATIHLRALPIPAV